MAGGSNPLTRPRSRAGDLSPPELGLARVRHFKMIDVGYILLRLGRGELAEPLCSTSGRCSDERRRVGSEMVAIEQLRYVRLIAGNLGQAADFAQRVLGLEPIDRTRDAATFRSDFRDYTLAFATGPGVKQSIGLEVRHSTDLDTALEALQRLGIAAGRGAAEDCTLRKVKDMIWFEDFTGNRIELVVRPLHSGWRYFPSRDAGVRGLADVIIRSADVERTCRSGPAFSAPMSAIGPAMRPIFVLTTRITGLSCFRPLVPAFYPLNSRSKTSIC